MGRVTRCAANNRVVDAVYQRDTDSDRNRQSNESLNWPTYLMRTDDSVQSSFVGRLANNLLTRLMTCQTP